MNQILRVAKIPYLNTLPFFLNDEMNTLLSTSPRRLGQEAAENKIDAGPLSMWDAWSLETDFEPIGPFGVAVKGPTRSVLVFSKVPLDNLAGAIVGVTDQTSTSLRLFEILLGLRYGVKARLQEGFSLEDKARLLIGNDALFAPEGFRAQFPHIYDLGREWYLWRERPFVFARWMVRRDRPASLKEELCAQLNASLSRFEKNPDIIARQAAEGTPHSHVRLRDYLTGFVYRLGPDELEAEHLFRTMVTAFYKKGGKT